MAETMQKAFQVTGILKNIKRMFFMLVFSVSLFLTSALISKSAWACCSCSGNCSCPINNHGDCSGSGTRGVICEQHELTETWITEEFQYHQYWIFDIFFHFHVLPAWMKATEQLSAVGMQQVQLIGAFMDAKQQLEVQRLLQKKEAEAHRDYHPDIEICAIGTAAKGLGFADRRGEFNAILLTQYSQDRQLGNLNSNASEGIAEDKYSRIEQFIDLFCDVDDNHMGLEPMCGPMTGARTNNLNKDIDFTRLIDMQRTLDVDFNDGAISDDEQAVMAMHNYLFSHDVFDRPTKSQISVLENQDAYYDLRAVVAKRSVAENSFNTIVGLKSKGGTSTSGGFMAALFQQLGGGSISAGDAQIMLGSDQPSYFAMMEVMSKKVYQHPDFFANLYGKPVNVRRKEVAMQAVDLMLGRDMYRSDLRSEALLALLLEMELSQYQEDLQDQMEIQINYNYGTGE